jgi:hypothetical protein
MPAIQVARTDTFEQQRQKINQLGSTLFNITAGGSDLSTGNLKLGDGTRIEPSLAFVSDPGLGIYKPSAKTIGYVGDGKRYANFSPDAFYSFKDIIVQQNQLSNSGITFNLGGSNYDPGTYASIPLTGGNGSGATASIEVSEYDGSITNYGKNYAEGSFSNIPLIGGNGTGATASFTVEGINGSISNGGSQYIPGSYQNIPLTTTGSGIGALANLTITGSTNTNGTITTPGSNYIPGAYTSIQIFNNPTQTFVVTSISNPGTPPPANVYSIDGSTKPTLNLLRGNTYRFDVSDASVSSHPLSFQTFDGDNLNSQYYIIVPSGVRGTSGAFVDLIITNDAPLTNIAYYCTVHTGMGNTISVSSGSTGSYGSGGFANVTVGVSGQVTDFSFTNSGSGYKVSDIVSVSRNNVGGSGSGFTYTISSFSYTGTVTEVTITNNGKDYEFNDILTVNNTSIGGSGTGFSYSITSNPGIITNFSFPNKGNNYEELDTLSLPEKVSNISTILKGQKTGVSTTLSNSSPIITVSSTAGIVAGMSVIRGPSDVGELANNTTVLSVDSLTQITLSSTPTVSGAATLDFISSGSFLVISVPSTVGIFQGSIVSKISGSGTLEANTTVASINALANTVTLSQAPSLAGTVILDFIPPYGPSVGETDVFEYAIDNLGVVQSASVISGGNGYLDGDILSVNSTDLTQPITYNVTNKSIQKIIFSGTVPSAAFSVGNTIRKKDGSITITSVTTSTAIIGQADQTYTNITQSATSGSGSGASFNIQRRDVTGEIDGVVIVFGGYNYQQGDTITINGNLVGGTTPADNVVITINSVSEEDSSIVYYKSISSGNINYIIVDSNNYQGSNVVVNENTSVEYTVTTAGSNEFRFFIDTGSGETITPNITLYSGNTYIFSFLDPSNSGHIFSLSRYRDGIWGPSLFENISSTLNTSTKQIAVSSTTGILPGMLVSVTSGSGLLLANTKVDQVVNQTTILLDKFPLTSGNVNLKINGVEYTDGLTRTSSNIRLKVSNDTPNLYYYCSTNNLNHIDEGGYDNLEAVLTVNTVNPKVFGTGFSITAAAVTTSDVIKADALDGTLECLSLLTNGITTQNLNSTVSISTQLLTSPNVSTSSITSSSNLAIQSSDLNISSSSINFGTSVQITPSTGSITTSGILKTTNSLNINDRINITDNIISSTTGNNILLTPATGRVAKINTTSAITIPSGTTAQRPSAGIVESGSIRFNTDTGQYEGYSGATTSWSSLGGVRDLDGNTYIAAEASVGANDNTLYFYNDGNNTLKITPTKFIFNVVKTIDSPNPLNPPSTEWAANTPVALNSYVFYGLNLYKVTTGGTTATSGNEPTHTTGTVANGTAQLEWYADYAGDVTFDKVKNVNINTNLVFNDELKLYDNKITTLLSDVVIEPFAGKKVDINTNTSLVLPNGTTGERGIPGQGSVRFNTSLSQFEGYNGVNWTSLGGVRDVDGNTYIIPETAPGANENILYFYNNGSNTLRLSTTELTFDTIDQIGSTSNNLDLQAQTVTFNSLALTVDNSGTSTKLLSTKTNIDLALSVGLYTNPLIRLNNTGDIYVNKGFGTATDTYIKVLDNELKTLEMDDTIISSSEYILTKGTTNSGASVIFDPTLHSGAKVILVANNTTTNHKDMIEFTVVAKDTDIFHTEYGNVVSGTDIIAPVFDFDAGGKVRLNVSLINGVTTGNVVNVTVVSTIIKK